jgi:hypothetical protein
MAKSIALAKCEEQYLFETSSGETTVGIDLGDRYSHCCVLGPDGVVLHRQCCAAPAVEVYFATDSVAPLSWATAPSVV